MVLNSNFANVLYFLCGYRFICQFHADIGVSGSKDIVKRWSVNCEACDDWTNKGTVWNSDLDVSHSVILDFFI